MTQRLRRVFGPVASRRLGRSLGIDLVPFKTCSFDCIYCQLGRTRSRTVELNEYVPTDRVLADMEVALASGVKADWITLSGSGEPTLHACIGDVIAAAKRLTDVPVAVLTNGSLLWDDRVRQGLARADLVIPSLDAADDSLFGRVNRPHESLSLDLVLEGLIAFRRGFRGSIWLEVFLLAGISDTDEHVDKLAEMARRLAPERIQLNTVARPPAEAVARPVPREALEHLAERFVPRAEVIAAQPRADIPEHARSGDEALVDLLARRPCSLEDVCFALGLVAPDALKQLDRLVRDGGVTATPHGGQLFYRLQAADGHHKGQGHGDL
jgi:wyosine [tRNA(Phe)-imidazoG37] synthetase (radical SAM superfamily)